MKHDKNLQSWFCHYYYYYLQTKTIYCTLYAQKSISDFLNEYVIHKTKRNCGTHEFHYQGKLSTIASVV